MSKEPQKYFPGNFVRHKIEGWTGVIYAVAIDDWDGVQTILYTIAFFGDPEEVGDKHYGLYWEPEIPEIFDIIPYPWQLFFKVGDKVKIVGIPNSGIITKISTFTESPKPLYVKTESAGGKEYIEVYAPHELIKIGEKKMNQINDICYFQQDGQWYMGK